MSRTWEYPQRYFKKEHLRSWVVFFDVRQGTFLFASIGPQSGAMIEVVLHPQSSSTFCHSSSAPSNRRTHLASRLIEVWWEVTRNMLIIPIRNAERYQCSFSAQFTVLPIVPKESKVHHEICAPAVAKRLKSDWQLGCRIGWRFCFVSSGWNFWLFLFWFGQRRIRS